MKMQGRILKMLTELKSPVQYTLPMGDHLLDMNQWIGKNIQFSFEVKFTVWIVVEEPKNLLIKDFVTLVFRVVLWRQSVLLSQNFVELI